MLHHTGAWSEKFLIEYLSVYPQQTSCHYVVWQTWTITQLANDERCTRHAGSGNYKGISSMNMHAIGIEVVSDGYNYTDIQRTAVRKLVSELMTKHNIEYNNIIRHKDYAYNNRKRDIGDNFRNPYFDSYEAYQRSYEKRKLTIEEQDYLNTMQENNWKMRHKTKNNSLRDLLNKINNVIREYKKA